ncbi:MAG: alpha/beta hydrolase [bacterium]|nr:alpha/beta hydrolase [bacterium]
MSEEETVRYPGARRPDRQHFVGPEGARLAVHEWGEPDGKPILLAHGGFDFAGTFDGFAPLLADEGYRVVCWDHRGHGDSDHAALYSWQADQRDALAVLDTISREPVAMIGHSKGGGVLMQLCEARPHRVSRFINIDGMPSKWNAPDVADHERTRLRDSELSAWLDHRRVSSELKRKPGTIDELAKRRGRMNPRLTHEWLRYLVPIGARKDADGWRWKIDPVMRFGGFGPWRPDWYLKRLPGFPVPLLGILGEQKEEMGWGTKPSEVEPYLPPDAKLVAFEDSGHFVHIEHPRRVADLCLEFLT